ncbi:TlpA family protein disulfide reductase [Pelagicoccus albus]|uniref:TlpA family protein disulfide reductase n=1 Tax=Pelagicoccus albus TaxID=415222 RepID=A0A7X1E940_9BACT|nr:TlpA disulfide reductase family protein [Pelagicoccus albus]MBC2606951.1 TlpA family protein disulfide reductase [Pelagicoccus albus]
MNLFNSLRASTLFAAVTLLFSAAFAGEAEHDELVAAASDKDADFEAALQESIDAGMPSDWILEAEIVRMLSTGDLAMMPDLIERIDSVGDEFRFGVDRSFYSTEQLAGFADTLRCVTAYRAGDKEAFEEYAIKSYAKAPGFNSIFGIGDLLARQKMEAAQQAAMADFKVPMDMVLANVEGDSKTIAEWMGDDKAMLVDFWASWCGPCIRLMPKLKEKQSSLSEQGIFVAGVNTDRNEQLESAVKVREREEMESVPWLLDRNGGDLSGLLMVDSIPRMVLIDRDGSVLYNGHPSDPSLGDALAQLGVELH